MLLPLLTNCAGPSKPFISARVAPPLCSLASVPAGAFPAWPSLTSLDPANIVPLVQFAIALAWLGMTTVLVFVAQAVSARPGACAAVCISACWAHSAGCLELLNPMAHSFAAALQAPLRWATTLVRAGQTQTQALGALLEAPIQLSATPWRLARGARRPALVLRRLPALLRRLNSCALAKVQSTTGTGKVLNQKAQSTVGAGGVVRDQKLTTAMGQKAQSTAGAAGVVSNQELTSAMGRAEVKGAAPVDVASRVNQGFAEAMRRAEQEELDREIAEAKERAKQRAWAKPKVAPAEARAAHVPSAVAAWADTATSQAAAATAAVDGEEVAQRINARFAEEMRQVARDALEKEVAEARERSRLWAARVAAEEMAEDKEDALTGGLVPSATRTQRQDAREIDSKKADAAAAARFLL